MGNPENGLDRLCKIYLNLKDEEKEKVIRLAEGLLNSQKTMERDTSMLTENMNKKESHAPKYAKPISNLHLSLLRRRNAL